MADGSWEGQHEQLERNRQRDKTERYEYIDRLVFDFPPPPPPPLYYYHHHHHYHPRGMDNMNNKVERALGAVASSQKVATHIGKKILNAKGNAADACVAMAAALNVSEPCSTGIGGDAFCLFYSRKEQKVFCVLGNGASPAGLTTELIHSRSFQNGIPPMHALNITTPGAAAAWCDINEKFGTLSLSTCLQPAIDLANNGFNVGPITAESWKRNAYQLIESETHGHDLLIGDGKGSHRAPQAGELFKNPLLAKVFEELAKEGKEGFYKGWVAQAIVEAVASRGGVLSVEDLEAHASDFQEPISTTYRGMEIWEVPLPTQGVVALTALNLMEHVAAAPEYQRMSHADRLHHDIECIRLAFAECSKHVGDPRVAGNLPIDEIISKAFARRLGKQLNAEQALDNLDSDCPLGGGHDTVYFCAVDNEGNGCSMINSNYMSFGTGIVPKGCGFSLQNRGHGFAPLDLEHPNRIGPKQRPYHTIIPGIATYPNASELYATFGVMGGFMQPQGHIQVLQNMLDLDMTPQEALDAPRFFVSVADYSLGETIFDQKSTAKPKIYLEVNIDEEVADALKQKGHHVISQVDGYQRCIFGRGQIIRWDPTGLKGVTAGSDPRADGCAICL